MQLSWNRPDNQSLILNLLLAVGSVLLMNGLIFSFGWDKSTDYAPSPWFEPPGWVVGAVWIGLFILMAIARWMLNTESRDEGRRARFWVTILAVSCLIYPLYSLAIGSVMGGMIGNVWTIALTGFVMSRLWRVSKGAAWLVFPIIPWVTFATAITVVELGWVK